MARNIFSIVVRIRYNNNTNNVVVSKIKIENNRKTEKTKTKFTVCIIKHRLIIGRLISVEFSPPPLLYGQFILI